MNFFLKPNIPVVFLVFISWLYIYIYDYPTVIIQV